VPIVHRAIDGWEILAPYYDQLYQKSDDLEFWAKSVWNLGGGSEKAMPRVLELGMGTGRVSLYLAARGFYVDGLETSAAMRKVIRNKLTDRTRRLVRAYDQDMRSFHIPRKYSIIICPYNTISTLLAPSDRVATFRSARKHLKPQGVLIFDLLRRDFGNILQHMRLGERNLWGYEAGQRYYPLRPSRISWCKYATIDPSEMLQTTEVTVTDSTSGVAKSATTTFPMRLLTRSVIESELTSAGFEIVAVHGDYDFGSFSAARSQLAAFVVRPRA